MFLKHLRVGFATNSSSSHSIVVVPRLGRAVIQPTDTLPHEEFQFGWDNFTLVSQKAKMKYLAAMVYDNLRDLPQWMINLLVQSITGEKSEIAYIDHQSSIALPRAWNGNGLDEQFLMELKDFLLKEDVLILGGNDNSDDHSITCGEPHKGLLQLRDIIGKYVCRKEGDDWILFDRLTGTKVVMSFVNNSIERKRPSAPELIDVKITDFCPYQCSYCYQDSSTNGKHGKINLSFLEYCERNRVFECALGGGEPTLHPEFTSILERFRDFGVTPNFSTRNLQWIRDPLSRSQILELCGAFAFSVDKAEQVVQLAQHCFAYNVTNEPWNNKYKATIHHVVGATSSEWEFSRILEQCHAHDLPITLLGWKQTGRGLKVHPSQWGKSWLDIVKQLVKEEKCPRIGIDTSLAKLYEKEIKKTSIPEHLFYTMEGKFSMYYNAVEDVYGPSSFCDSSEYIKRRNAEEAWKEIGVRQNGSK